MKKITINGNEFDIDCNAYTRFLYKKEFGVGIFKDLEKLTNFSNLQNEKRKELEGKSEEEINTEINKLILQNIDDFLDVILQVAYILILTANSNVGNFQSFLKKIDKINVSEAWISEVTELAVNSFLGQ